MPMVRPSFGHVQKPLDAGVYSIVDSPDRPELVISFVDGEGHEWVVDCAIEL